MKLNLKRTSVLVVSLIVASLWCTTGRAQDDGADAAAPDVTGEPTAEQESKLLKWITLENAFLKAVQQRRLLQRVVAGATAKLEEITDETEEDTLRTELEKNKKQLQAVSIAMNVIFGVQGRPIQYEYNTVTSTVYLRVGTVEQAFARMVRTRDRLRGLTAQQEAFKETLTDEEKIAEIERRIQLAKRQYQTVAAALQLVFGVTPERNYLYNPKDSTLYLRITETEVEKLRQQLAKIQEDRQAALEDTDEEPAATGE